MSVVLGFASPKARQEFMHCYGNRDDKTNNLMYISHLGEYIVLDNVSDTMLQKLRSAPEIEVYDDSQLEPFDAPA